MYELCLTPKFHVQVDPLSVSKSLDAATKEKIQIIRLSLARNLSRAIIIEGSDIPNTNARMVNASWYQELWSKFILGMFLDHFGCYLMNFILNDVSF